MIIPRLIDSVIFANVAISPANVDVAVDLSAETMSIAGLQTVIPLRKLIGKPVKTNYSAGVPGAYALTFTTAPVAGDTYRLIITKVYKQPSILRGTQNNEISVVVAANATATAAALRTQFYTLLNTALSALQVAGIFSAIASSGTSTILITSASADYDLTFRLSGTQGGTTLAVVADGTTVDSAVTVAWVPPAGTYAQVVLDNPGAVVGTNYSFVTINFRHSHPGIGIDGTEEDSPAWVKVFANSADADTNNFLQYIVDVSTLV